MNNGIDYCRYNILTVSEYASRFWTTVPSFASRVVTASALLWVNPIGYLNRMMEFAAFLSSSFFNVTVFVRLLYLQRNIDTLPRL